MTSYWNRVVWLALIVLLAPDIAVASLETVGPNGINSAGLTQFDGTTVLTGMGIDLDQVEPTRPGEVGTDDPSNVNTDVVPADITLTFGAPIIPNASIGNGHATRVAGVIISTDGTDSDSDGDAPLGVSPNADLYSSAYLSGVDNILLTNQYVATVTQDVRAINHSWGTALQGGETLNGNSQLTLGLDWSARVHDVLHVKAGNQGQMLGLPSDNFNGMTIARSDRIGGAGLYRQVSANNTFDEDAAGTRTSVDLIAPGEVIETADIGNIETTISGSSYSAPHVTGAVGLLQEYAEERIANSFSFGWMGNANARKHVVMKAVLMNSADKIQDDGTGKYLGMQRTVLMQGAGNTDTWLDSPAFTDQTIPLDLEMGTGHLNASRALQQFLSGEVLPSVNSAAKRPKIGWDLGRTRDVDEITKYSLLGEMEAGIFFSATLAWDRATDFSSDVDDDGEFDAGDTYFEVGLTNLDLYLVPVNSTSINDAVWSSKSTVSSVEHIFYEIETTGEYEVWVHQQGALVIPPDEDFFTFRQEYGIAWWGGDSLSILGDFDSDGDVDGDDLSQWEGDYGLNGDSDADGDGDSDGTDFLAWQRNFGTGVPLVASSQAVPEPSTCFLLASGGILWLCRNRSSRGLR